MYSLAEENYLKAIYHLESFAAHVMEQVVIAKNYKMLIE